jgi:hypothetical protein
MSRRRRSRRASTAITYTVGPADAVARLGVDVALAEQTGTIAGTPARAADCGSVVEEIALTIADGATRNVTVTVALRGCADVGTFAQLADLHLVRNDAVPAGGSAWPCVGVQPPSASSMPPFGIVGCDPPDRLVNTALDAATAGGAVDFAIITGDFARHDAPSTATISSAISDVRAAWPAAATPVVAVIGNNDVFPDYNAPATAAGFASVLSALGPWAGQQSSLDHHRAKVNVPEGPRPEAEEGQVEEEGEEMEADVAADPAATQQLGFRSTAVPGAPQHRVLVLSTVLYSLRNGQVDAASADPAGLAWLRAELDAARAGTYRVLLTGHIPPGMSSHDGSAMYHPAAQTALIAVLEQYTDVIAMGVFAHTHMDEFRLLGAGAETGGLPVLLTLAPAVSPIFGNLPGYRTYTFDRHTLTMLSYEQFTADIRGLTAGQSPAWTSLYKSTDAGYAFPALVPEVVKTFATAVLADPRSVSGAAYAAHRFAGIPSKCPVDSGCARRAACGIEALTPAAFAACNQ